MMLEYKTEISKAMAMLANNSSTLFIGQSVCYPGHIMFNTLEEAKIPMEKRIELPVIEDCQMGMSIGLALMGYIPISIFPRMDFLICAMNQLCNHLDRMEEMSNGQFKPKVIIRTMVGSVKPMNPGPQHRFDYTLALKESLTNILIYWIDSPHKALDVYRLALESEQSSIVVEYGDLY